MSYIHKILPLIVQNFTNVIIENVESPDEIGYTAYVVGELSWSGEKLVVEGQENPNLKGNIGRFWCSAQNIAEIVIDGANVIIKVDEYWQEK